MGWGGVLTSFVVRTSNYVSIPCKTSSKYVVIFPLNFQLQYHLWSDFVQLWCYFFYQLPTTLSSLVRFSAATLLSFLSTSNYVTIQLRCYLLYQLPSSLASLVRHLPSTLFFSLSTSNYVSDVSDWQNLGTDVTKAWLRKKTAFMCQNHGPAVTLWNGPPKIEYLSGDEMSIFDGQRTEKQ